jgi:hypothetical protein
MGNQNNGNYRVNLVVQGDLPEADVPVVCTYVILNSGRGNPGTVEKATESALAALGAKAAQVAAGAAGTAIGATLGAAIGTAMVPVVGTALGALAGWLTSSVGDFVFANCDGVVATGMRVFRSNQLALETSNGRKVTETVEHLAGTPDGCNRRSHYFTTTSLSSFVRIRPIVPLDGVWRYGGRPGPVISTQGNLITVDMSAFRRPVAHGSILNSSDITVSFPDDKTYRGRLRPPGTIEWSNASVWSRG